MRQALRKAGGCAYGLPPAGVLKGAFGYGYDQPGVRKICQLQVKGLAAVEKYGLGLCCGGTDLYGGTGVAPLISAGGPGRDRSGDGGVDIADFPRGALYWAGLV